MNYKPIYYKPVYYKPIYPIKQNVVALADVF